MTTILTKIKYKGILFENIQGYVSKRHYILPYLISKDNIFQEQLKIYNGILKDNQLSSNFINGLYAFISDRMLFRIVHEETEILQNENFYQEDEITNIYQTYKKRLISIYHSGTYKQGINISINKLKVFIPKKEEFALFLFDFLQQKGTTNTIFPNYDKNLISNFDLTKFSLYYKENKAFFDNEIEVSAIEMEKYYANMNRKTLINLAFIGNKSSGKSTTIGHLLYSTGNIGINSELYQNAVNTAAQLDSKEYRYCFLINTHRDERLRRQTIMYHLNQFETNKYDFNLIDLPGDFHLRKNMIKGLSLADAVVCVISAENENQKNAHINDYLIIAYTRGIRQVIFAINKLDLTKDPQYSEKIFLKIKDKMMNLCLNIGFSSDDIQFIPYSGYTGHHLVNRYDDFEENIINKMAWYKGKTLLEALDEIKPVKRDFDGKLIISIFKAYTITGVGIIIRGKILSGKLTKKEKIYLNFRYEIVLGGIDSIQIYDKKVDQAVAGDIISLHIKYINYRDAKLCNLAYSQSINSFGNLSQKELLQKFPISKYISLRAKIFMLDKKTHLRKGYTLTLFSYSLNAPINIEKIEYLVDGGNRIIKEGPEEIKYGEYAIVKLDLKTLNPRKIFIFDKFKNNQLLGSFELFNDYFIAVGKILDIEYN